MDRTLTIRLDKAQDQALEARARALGKTRSELVRDLIDRAVSPTPMRDRIGHLKGRLELKRAQSSWRAKIRARNWR